MTRWLAYWLMTIGLGAAVLLSGGVVPSQWQWSALALSVGAVVWVLPEKHNRTPAAPFGMTILAILLGWFVFQAIPLPPDVVAWLSPQRAADLQAARAFTGVSQDGWFSLSVAPPATLDRLLAVVPAMAVFVAAREMAWHWHKRLWICFLPIVGIAGLEAILGILQYLLSGAGSAAQNGGVTGTYVNRNHFAGLVEIAIPITVMWAVSVWRKGTTRDEQPIGVAIGTAALAVSAACMLMGVILSLSRMGFISTLAAAVLTSVFLISSMGSTASRWSKWRWVVPVAVIAFIVALLPTRQLILRFADMAATEEVTQDTRMGIWNDTVTMTANYSLAGCGLGAYEQCFYRYKQVAPDKRVDFAHNDYLQVHAELGWPGTVIVAVLGGWILSRVINVVVSKRGIENWEYAVGILGAILTIALHSLVDFNFYIPANAAAFAWIAGIGVSPGLKAW